MAIAFQKHILGFSLWQYVNCNNPNSLIGRTRRVKRELLTSQRSQVSIIICKIKTQHVCIYCLKILDKLINLVKVKNFGKSREIW